MIDDFDWDDETFTIHLLRKKKLKHSEDDEPLVMSREFEMLDEVIEWLKSERWKTPLRDKYKQIRKDADGNMIFNQRPWNIKHKACGTYVSEVFPDYFPHYMRFDYCTSGSSDPETSLNELQSKTCLTLQALQAYIKPSKKAQLTFDKHKIERLKSKGAM
jgi:hypothetical protein